jgi:hypothetical protein
MVQRAFRVDGDDPDDECFFGSGRPPSPESDLWSSVLGQQLADAKLGVKILRGDRTGGDGALYNARQAAGWLLDRRAHRTDFLVDRSKISRMAAHPSSTRKPTLSTTW